MGEKGGARTVFMAVSGAKISTKRNLQVEVYDELRRLQKVITCYASPIRQSSSSALSRSKQVGFIIVDNALNITTLRLTKS
jgi:hypothetical protein